MLPHWEMLLRIVVGAGLGGIIGYERDVHGRPAGLRTHFIVALASSTFMVVSTHFVYYQGYHREDLVAVDPSRIAASVVTGIGFLAGGTILRTGLNVQGLTTAAGLWLVASIGLCAGGGMFVESGIVTLLGVIALTLLRRFEDKNDQLVLRRVALTLDGSQSVTEVVRVMTEMGAKVSDLEYERRLDDQQMAVTFDVRLPASTELSRVVQALEAQPGVRRVHVRVPT